MKNFFHFLVSTLLVLSCTPNSAGGTPEWPWTEPDTPPAVAEPNPAVVEKGWTNVSASYTLPEGLQVYKSPSSLQGVKAVAYLAVADPSKIAWDVWSIPTRRQRAPLMPSKRLLRCIRPHRPRSL